MLKKIEKWCGRLDWSRKDVDVSDWRTIGYGRRFYRIYRSRSFTYSHRYLYIFTIYTHTTSRVHLFKYSHTPETLHTPHIFTFSNIPRWSYGTHLNIIQRLTYLYIFILISLHVQTYSHFLYSTPPYTHFFTNLSHNTRYTKTSTLLHNDLQTSLSLLLLLIR